MLVSRHVKPGPIMFTDGIDSAAAVYVFLLSIAVHTACHSNEPEELSSMSLCRGRAQFA